MRAIQTFFALALSLALLAPASGFAQSRGHGQGHGHAKPAKAEKPHHPQKAQKSQKAAKSHAARKPDRARKPEKAPKKAHPQKPQRPDPAAKAAKPNPARKAAPTARREIRPDDRVARSGNLRFRGMDGNGDRRITRREWRGNDVSFANQDWNGDGILSGSEVLPGARRGAARPADLFTRIVRIERQDHRTRRVRSERLDRDTRLLRLRFGPTAVRTAWRDTTGLRFYEDGFGRRSVRAPAPLVTRIDHYYGVTRNLDPYRPTAPDLVRIDFGLDFDGPYRPTGPDNLLGALALPVALMVTNALVGDVDRFVTTERFASYDRDYDGYVAPSEWPVGAPAFTRYDLDGDGYLVAGELYGDDDLIVVDRDRFLLFQGMDRDNDGLVAPWEWPGDLDSFWYRDYNADGAVSLDEFLGLEVDRPVRALDFDGIDYDRDGEIARVEWVGNPYRFARLDRNGNGVVGRWEYAYGWLRGA